MADGLLLVIERRGTQATLDSGSILIRSASGGTQRIALHLVESVAVYGNALVSCDLWRALARHHIPATLLPQRGRDEPAWLGAGLQATLHHRRAQHAADPATALRLARSLVARKMTNLTVLLQTLAEQPDHPALGSPRPAADPVLQRIRAGIAQLDACTSIPCLMGCEGAASAAWFGWLAAALQPHWHFAGRNRRPPRDPLNALLSLGYTLLAGEVQQAVTLCGLDPALGFLHQDYPGRSSLTLD